MHLSVLPIHGQAVEIRVRLDLTLSEISSLDFYSLGVIDSRFYRG